MPRKGDIEDLTGRVFGRLTVVGIDSETHAASGRVSRRWACVCECGKKSDVLSMNLNSGHTKSCGCLRADLAATKSKTHGAASHRNKTPTYRSWASMIMRCTNPARWQFKYYGGRGITVCPKWRESFAAFLADVGERPDGTTLDRIDNDRGYEPGNCRWATRQEQARNSRRVRLIEHNGESHPVVVWSERTGIPAKIIQQRLARGWSAARALSPNDLARKA